jgi:endoglucanase
VLEGASHPLPLVATAAAGFAAGADVAGTRLLEAAERLDEQTPTYYGAAWVALGRAFLTTDLLEASVR